MTDYFMPQDIVPSKVRWSNADSTAMFASDTSGAIRTSEIVGGGALMAAFKWPPLRDDTDTLNRRSRALTILKRLRGQAERIWLGVPNYRQKGSFPAPELLPNNAFLNGTTGWTASSDITGSVSGGVYRALRNANTAAAVNHIRTSSVVTVTQYAPYVVRAAIGSKRGSASVNVGFRDSSAASLSFETAAATQGLRAHAYVPLVTSVHVSLSEAVSTSSIAGDFLEIPYISLARCMLADNRPNAMTRSDELDNAAWNKDRTSATANAATAADGSTTMDAVVENTDTNSHAIRPATHPTRTSQAEDLIVFGEFKRGAGTRDIQLRVGSSSANHGSAHFNLSTGVASNLTNTGTATNTRAFSVDLGNGVWLCCVVASVAASTELYSQYNLLNAGSNNYAGDGSSSVYARRLGCARSALPITPAQTVAAAAATGTAQTGVGLYVKGLPASTAGLLLPGDIVQIGRSIHWVVSPLNSDAAGCGYLVLDAPPRFAPADNDPIIVCNPLCKYLQAKNILDWEDSPGAFTELEVEFIEATGG